VSNELERAKGGRRKREEVRGSGKKGEDAVVTKLQQLTSSPV